MGAAGLACFSTSALALSSDWVEGQSSRVRLIAAETALGADGTIVLGLEITMDPGWKTYWRTPGEAGIPPQFDWSNSENLGALEISWPVPHRVEFFGMDAFTYTDRILLPIRISATVPANAVSLKLNIGYGVCSDLCILESADIDLPLPAGAAQPSLFADAIDLASANVPLTALDGLAISDAVVRRRADKTDIEVSVAGWAGPGGGEMTPDGGFDVFLEAGPDYLFGRARYKPGIGQAPGRFVVPMVAGPEVSHQGVELKVTAVSPAGAVEVPLILSDP